MSFKCQRCGRCCSDPTIIVTLTHRDLLRFEYLLPDIDLFKVLAFYQTQNDEISLEEKLMSPAIITNRGKIFLGLQKKADKCIFFENMECQVYECRPLICHCFPYTFKLRNDEIYWGYTKRAEEYCPAIKNNPNFDEAELESLAIEMNKESEEFKQLILIWNHLAQNGLIDPTPQLLVQFLTGKIKLTLEKMETLKE